MTAKILPFPTMRPAGARENLLQMRSLVGGYELVLEVLSDHGDRQPEIRTIIDVPAFRHEIDSREGRAALRILDVHANAPLPYVRVQLLEFTGEFGRIDYSLDDLQGNMAMNLLEPR